MKAKVPLFRGEPRHVWVRRLEQRGWPGAAATEMAAFLTEKGIPPQAWQDLVAQNAVASVDQLIPGRRRTA